MFFMPLYVLRRPRISDLRLCKLPLLPKENKAEVEKLIVNPLFPPRRLHPQPKHQLRHPEKNFAIGEVDVAWIVARPAHRHVRRVRLGHDRADMLLKRAARPVEDRDP